MTPRDLFGVFVRSVATLALAYALWTLSLGAVMRIGIMRDQEGYASDWLAQGFGLFVAAVAMLFAAPTIVALAYGQGVDDAPYALRANGDPQPASSSAESEKPGN